MHLFNGMVPRMDKTGNYIEAILHLPETLHPKSLQ